MDLEYMKTLKSTEVGSLHELNRLLIESKEPAAADKQRRLLERIAVLRRVQQYS